MGEPRAWGTSDVEMLDRIERDAADLELLAKVRKSPWIGDLLEDIEASRDVDAVCEFYPDKREAYTALLALLSPGDANGGGDAG